MKVRYSLTYLEKLLAFQVLELDPEQDRRRKQMMTKVCGEFLIHPDAHFRDHLSRLTIGMRPGAAPGIRTFNSNEERDAFAEKLKAALKKWSADGGF